MHRLIENFFKLKDLHTNIRIEIVAGLTTFMTMAYIIFVNPAMVSQTGIDFGAAMMATYRGKEVSWLVYLLAVLFILRFLYLKTI
jgi:AGZA family xanthine/uracil permease-like MFS transporter